MTVFLFFCVMLSGSAFCAAKYQKRTDITFPITCMGFCSLLFLFGIAGILQAGLFVIFAIAAVLWATTIQEAWKLRNDRERLTRDFLRPFLTPGLLVFTVVMAVQYYALRGSLAHVWDEFSHWVDIVKVMTTLDDFGTNPLSYSAYRAYLPGITLFQYMMQKTHLLFHPNETFVEWLTYMAYQFYMVALTLPLLSRERFRNPLGTILLSAFVLGFPIIFYSNCYFSAYSEPFMAIAAGAGLSTVMFWKDEEKDSFYSAYIFLAITTLVLAKEMGLIFAAFLAILYIGDKWIRERKITKRFWIHAAAAFIAITLPRALWKWKLVVSEVPVSSRSNIDMQILFDVLAGRDNSYRAEVFANYKQALLKPVHYLSGMVSISYLTMCVCTLAALGLALILLVFLKDLNWKSAVFYFLTESALLMLYLTGMCVIYMFNFSEYEGVRLASMSRYLGVAFLAIHLPVFALIARAFRAVPTTDRLKKIHFYASAVLRCAILIPVTLWFVTQIWPSIRDRTDYRNSIQLRAAYESLEQKISRNCNGHSFIFVISQQTTGFDWWILRFSSRPNIVNNAWEWSVGDGPFYEGDVWTHVYSPEDLQERIKNNFDYVAIYHANDFLKERYGTLFENPDDIADSTLFQVNSATGTLRLVA